MGWMSVWEEFSWSPSMFYICIIVSNLSSVPLLSLLTQSMAYKATLNTSQRPEYQISQSGWIPIAPFAFFASSLCLFSVLLCI
ncbi:hypothetical protein R3P38DRAFT_2875820 [Favolaschia claudopus]|uniref:Uncharacterized protein n=1 Tax=Favolaschia claudopus TaxID=2862362 RepID=A0AAW0D7L7_9AGAR